MELTYGKSAQIGWLQCSIMSFIKIAPTQNIYCVWKVNLDQDM